MRITQKAFSIVELAVVIAVLGILATITAVGYTKLQRDARDTERASDIAIIQSALETYYEKNGRYPYSAEVNETFLRNTLSLPASAIKAPDATATNSVAYSTSTSPSTMQYLYDSRYGASTACTTAANPCTKYTLRWRQETDNAVQSSDSKYGW